jgi:hypothetical protein
MRSAAAPVSLVSIGYEGRTADELIATLVDARVTMLVDVRPTPRSRKPGLSRRRLQASLEAVGIEYRHVSALGNPKENREHFRTGDLDRGRSVFAELLSHGDADSALADLAEVCQREHVAGALLRTGP